MSDVLLAVPNVSEGRDDDKILRIAGPDVLHVHSDVDHHRSVLTYGGRPSDVVDAAYAMVERAVSDLDITAHSGVHPRFGVVDVLPFVPYRMDENRLREIVAELIWRIAQGPGVPTLTYGRTSADDRPLPDLRRSLRQELPVPHPSAGIICVGIRDPLIAFNVNCSGPLRGAQRVARELRRKPGIRALAFELPSRGLVQLSMNLVDIDHIGPAIAFELATGLARGHALNVIDAEVVGIVPERMRPQLTDLPLRWPVRTIEELLPPTTI